MPKVTAYVPSYNLSKFIGPAIESILSQSFTDFELLIEDDGSTDDSLEVIGKYLHDPRVVLLARTENKGANWTTNSIVKRATGEYIAPLCADDVWEPGKLAKQVAYLDEHKECGIVFGWPQFVRDNGALIEIPEEDADSHILKMTNCTKEEWRIKFKAGNFLFISTAMWRNSLHQTVGYFDESYPILCDLEFYIRIVKDHDLHVMQEPLAKITQRDDGSNLSAPTHANLSQNFEDLERIHATHYPVVRDKKKYMIATPFYEVKGYSPYIRSLVQTVHALTKWNVPFEWIDRSGDSYVWRARNAIIDTFMRSDSTELIFIDSDHSWTLESFFRLLKADVDIVGAAYPVKNNWHQFGVTIHTKGENFVADTNEDGLIRGDKVPTGFMKIKREVFEKMKAASPNNWYWEGKSYKMYNYFGHLTINNVAYGEDISFCKRWQALGGEIWVEPRCTISHYGTKAWTGNYHEYLLKRPGGSNDPERKVA